MFHVVGSELLATVPLRIFQLLLAVCSTAVQLWNCGRISNWVELEKALEVGDNLLQSGCNREII